MAKTKRNSTKKEIIISKAAKLFTEKSYTGTSMRDLAEEVGVEAASLYNHIQSKAEILQVICFRVANIFMDHIDKIEKNNHSSIDKIKSILRFHIWHMINNYDEVQVADREWRHLSEPYLSNYKVQRKNYHRRIAVIIEYGIRKKEIKAIDAPTAVLIMLHAISGIESWHRSEQRISSEQLEKNMIVILVDGLEI